MQKGGIQLAQDEVCSCGYLSEGVGPADKPADVGAWQDTNTQFQTRYVCPNKSWIMARRRPLIG
jgi:hypothetical protein